MPRTPAPLTVSCNMRAKRRWVVRQELSQIIIATFVEEADARAFVALPALQWQPIETYEHGDRADVADHVLVCLVGGLVGEAYFNPKAYGGTWWWSGTNDGEFGDTQIHSPVTHWMPLPEPPAALAQADGPAPTEE